MFKKDVYYVQREKLRKAAMKVEVARVRLKEENNQLREVSLLFVHAFVLT